MSPSAFRALFAVFVVAALAWRAWLSMRQMRHVRRHREAVPADFAPYIPLEAHHRAADYTLDKQRVGLAETLVIDGVLLFALTLGGGLAIIDRMSEQWLGDGMAREMGTVFGVLLVTTALALPFDAYRTFVVEARHGFNRTTPKLFVLDILKGAALSIALGAPLLIAIFWLVRAAGPLWWFYTWMLWIAFTLALVTAFPRWIAPLFNRFTPLGEGDLRRRIETLIERCGFHAQGLFVMDGSRRSSHGNAYFTGFGANKRIVFFDTLIERLTPSEIEAVLAHELGHFARGHIPRLLAVRFALALLLLAVLGWLYQEHAFYQAFGMTEPHIGAALAGFA
ncbi:MAG TPA: M48 family metallopeptidase, partial [Usitatibacter sp.]|nr:M48 family metallopeptidase [Usitatibacter sp.]